MWRFSYHKTLTFSFKDVKAGFLNQCLTVLKYAYRHIYGTVFRKTGSTTWVEDRRWFDSHLHPLKWVSKLAVKATIWFCKIFQAILWFCNSRIPKDLLVVLLERTSVQSFHQLATKAKLLYLDFEDYIGVLRILILLYFLMALWTSAFSFHFLSFYFLTWNYYTGSLKLVPFFICSSIIKVKKLPERLVNLITCIKYVRFLLGLLYLRDFIL